MYRGRFLRTLSVDSKEVAGWAGEAATNAVAKLIPLAQRIVLERMSVREALNFKPLVPDASRLVRFHELLALLPVTFKAWEHITGTPTNFREFILCTKESKKTKKSKKEVTEEEVKNSHYSAKNILNAPPRRVADWWIDLRRLLDLFHSVTDNKDVAVSEQNEIHRQMVFAIGRVCYWAISEDHMLPTRERSTYRQALRINPAGIWELGKVVDAIPDIDRSYHLFRLLSETPNDLRASVHPASRIVINHGKGWIWRPGGGGQFFPPTILDPADEPDYGAVPRFNEDTTYSLMLLHDLLALGPDWQVMRQSVRINRPVERWVATRWRGDRKSARIPWPAPAPLSYWEVDLFVHYWNKVVDECEELLLLRSVEGTLGNRSCMVGSMPVKPYGIAGHRRSPCATRRQKRRCLNGKTWPRR